MRPSLTYTLWFTQRQGSSLLCDLLSSTGIAGKPNELFRMTPDELVPGFSKQADYIALQQAMYRQCSTPNGVMGFKGLILRADFDQWMERFRHFVGVPKEATIDSPALWDEVFPNCHHVFLTRRNHVRLAVSWWKAIVTQEWHRPAGGQRPYNLESIRDRYDRDAIRHLVQEVAFREAAIQDFFTAANIQPLTLVYEDWIQQPTEAVYQLLQYLGLSTEGVKVVAPTYDRLADQLTDEWVERFRLEEQASWEQPVW